MHEYQSELSYDSKSKLLTDWIQGHESNEVSRLVLPTPTVVILGAYGQIEVTECVTNDDSTKYKAESTIGGYRRAVITLYKEHLMSKLLSKDELSEFFSRYNGTIAGYNATPIP